MSYLAPIHRPSSVRHALKLNLLSATEECLVLAKANRIEIWVHSPSTGGLVLHLSKSIYGRISMLSKIRPLNSPTDHLFIGTLRFKYFTVAWNASTQQLETIQSFEDLSESHMKESQSRDICLVDPSGRYVMLELFEGVINLIKILKPRKGKGDYFDRAEQIRIAELRVRASAFLYTETNKPKIAFLYSEGRGGDVKLATYRVVDDKLHFRDFNAKKDRENELADLDPGASHLIPVPRGGESQRRHVGRNSTVAKAHLGGLIIVGEARMTYLDDESKATVEYYLPEPSIFSAWEQLDELNYLLADIYGSLHLLTLLVDSTEVMGMELKNLGKTTRATTMVHLGEGIVFLASHEGDSQLVQISLDSEQDSITLLQTMANIAPILDFTVMDMGNREGETQSNEYSSGQARLVTGSGSFQNGSLRSVRSGVGLEDEGILADMENISGVFALRSSSASTSDDTLVVSLPVETRVFTFDSQGDIEELDNFRGLSLDQHTLLAMNLPDGYILQVTSTSAAILGPGPRFSAAEWKPPVGYQITAAAANSGHVLLSANGVTLVSLDISQGLKEVATQALSDGDQVACIHVPNQIPGVGVVGFWKSGSISILRLQNLSIIQSEDLRRKNNASIPRGIALAQLLPPDFSGPNLLVAMEDGIVLTFSVSSADFSLTNRKSVVLGTQQAQFHILPLKSGLSNIFATCEHPSLIYGSEGRIVYSAVTADSALAVCNFDSEAYPDSIIVATPSLLKISKIDTERRTHVRTLPMSKTVRRIAYSPAERAFGIGCVKRNLINGEEIVSNTFLLAEDVMFGQIGQEYTLEAGNNNEVLECVTCALLPTAYGEGAPIERFIVGTSFLTSADSERGRLLVFGIDAHRSPFLVTELALKGACRAVTILGDKLVAALTKTVVVYSYLETTSKSATISKLASYRCATCPIDLTIQEGTNIIAVADLQKSLALLEFVPGKEGLPDELVELARHYQSVWATAISHLEGNSFLEADQEGNVLVLRRNEEGVTREDRRRLEVIGEFGLGEMVNRIRRVEVQPTAGAIVVPRAFLATASFLLFCISLFCRREMLIAPQTEGSIHLLSTISPQYLTLLFSLQSALSTVLSSLGNISFASSRSFKNMERETAEPFRFVDGELVERFLDLAEEEQESVCRGIGWGVEDVRGVVEELRRLH